MPRFWLSELTFQRQSMHSSDGKGLMPAFMKQISMTFLAKNGPMA
jgi:hypothetical protein